MNIAVLISGSGSNLQAIIDAASYNIQCVISNRPDAYGLERAKSANIATHVIDHTAFNSRKTFDETLKTFLDTLNTDLIALAGFMRRLGPDIANYFMGKMINIHPSLLPKYPGLHTFEKALTNKDTQHGCSIHYVTPEVDCGPLIAQANFDIEPEDTVESLKVKTQQLEHKLYPYIIKLIAQKRIHMENGSVFLGNQRLPAQGLQFSQKNPIP